MIAVLILRDTKKKVKPRLQNKVQCGLVELIDDKRRIIKGTD